MGNYTTGRGGRTGHDEILEDSITESGKSDEAKVDGRRKRHI